MQYFIYILYSIKSDVYYVGYTSNIKTRLHQHNFGERLTYTSKHRPWELKALFYCSESESDAVRIESFIKKQRNRLFIERLITSDQLTGILAQLVRVPKLRD